MEQQFAKLRPPAPSAPPLPPPSAPPCHELPPPPPYEPPVVAAAVAEKKQGYVPLTRKDAEARKASQKADQDALYERWLRHLDPFAVEMEPQWPSRVVYVRPNKTGTDYSWHLDNETFCRLVDHYAEVFPCIVLNRGTLSGELELSAVPLTHHPRNLPPPDACGR